jgi:YVTN family beta-propeller protein
MTTGADYSRYDDVAKSGDNTVSVIDTSTNTVVAKVNVGNDPFAFGNFIGALPACLGTTLPPRPIPRPRPRPSSPPRH